MRKILVVVGVGLCLVGQGLGASPAFAAHAKSTDPLAGIAVPDAFTSLVVTPISEPTFPYRGTDGKFHVVYDLQVTNASRATATLDRVDVVDAHHQRRVVGSIAGKQLVDPSCGQGDCNRLRVFPSAPAEDTTIGPNESRALFIDLAFATLKEAPKAVMHRIIAEGADKPGARDAVSLNFLAAPFDISSGSPRVIDPPLRGRNWVALNGAGEIGWPHRTSLNTTNGALVNTQRFAIDWKRTDPEGSFYAGDRTKNESYADYGQKIYAVANGTVVATLNTEDANAPGVLPASDPALAAKLTIENIDGNHIILNIGGGVYAMYAHLIKGSLLVKPGDKVKRGQVIARLGNTGNSNASHLHFQLQTRPSILTGDGLPYELSRFRYRGVVVRSVMDAADDYLSGDFLQGAPKQGEARKNELPMVLSIIDFPDK